MRKKPAQFHGFQFLFDNNFKRKLACRSYYNGIPKIECKLNAFNVAFKMCLQTFQKALKLLAYLSLPL